MTDSLAEEMEKGAWTIEKITGGEREAFVKAVPLDRALEILARAEVRQREAV